jgi:hypothetical protein
MSAGRHPEFKGIAGTGVGRDDQSIANQQVKGEVRRSAGPGDIHGPVQKEAKQGLQQAVVPVTAMQNTKGILPGDGIEAS